MIDIDQDPLVCQGVPVKTEAETVIYVKPLEYGTLAVGLFDRGDTPAVMGFTPHSLGMWGEKTLRDVWRQQDIGTFRKNERYEMTVNPHGVMLLRITPPLQQPEAGHGRTIDRSTRIFSLRILIFTELCRIFVLETRYDTFLWQTIQS